MKKDSLENLETFYPIKPTWWDPFMDFNIDHWPQWKINTKTKEKERIKLGEDDIQNVPGIYMFVDNTLVMENGGIIIYIGRTVRLRQRLQQHIRRWYLQKKLYQKLNELISQDDLTVFAWRIDDDAKRLGDEVFLIQKFNPIFNLVKR